MSITRCEWIGAVGSLFFCLIPVVVDARPLLLTSEQASATYGVTTVAVKPGSSLPISFLNSSERIYKVWFSKPTAIQVEGDVPLCSQSSCSAIGASVLYLRIPVGAKVEGQVVTVSTLDSNLGRGNLYNFKLVASNNPHTVVAIAPQPNNLVALTSSVSSSVFYPLKIEQGLAKAKDQNLIEPEFEAQIREFLSVYTGDNLQEALQQSGLSVETVQKLQSLAGS